MVGLRAQKRYHGVVAEVGMTAIRIVDYPRFMTELIKVRRDLYPDLGQRLTSNQFKYLMKSGFDLDVEVHTSDLVGVFYLRDEDAVLFVLRWS